MANGGVITFWRVDVEDNNISLWKRMVGIRSLADLDNPSIFTGSEMVMVKEERRTNQSTNVSIFEAVSMSKLNIITKASHTFLYTPRTQDLLIKEVVKIGSTIFIDNLPTDVTKRDLYKEFGNDHYIVDVYISRKIGKSAKNPFGFIRYYSNGGARKAISRLNGSTWKGVKLLVAVPKYGDRTQKNPVIKQRWIPKKVSTVISGDKGIDGAQAMLTRRRKEVIVDWADDQKQMLQRSLLGVCVEPIEFREE
ncbi:hypothetical protein PIB30_004762 [Stylosanthes scabra]|uniref:RRM domain-containing protein n=1 Tax=Stylosanthes scabra TaxID=79078 RepID=A0ABU6T3G3_9FABA|nr:hypothetical protein [Stylosanthes scabra]